VGFAAGGPNDILARLIGQWLSKRLGQPFIIENRLGAGSNIATEAVVHAPPDGYTLLLVGSPNAINATLYEKLSFNFLRDIAPVASFMRGALVMVVHPSVPAKTLPEFIAYAKANPGKLSYGSGGVGGITHITPELLKMMAGIEMVHVPYRGVAPALTDLLGGQVQMFAADAPVLMSNIKGGKIRALGGPPASVARCCRMWRRSPSKAIPTPSWTIGTACSRRRRRRPQSSPKSTRHLSKRSTIPASSRS
jgi:tripartite-type tricarboxylate transporter receptor subunit TctC